MGYVLGALVVVLLVLCIVSVAVEPSASDSDKVEYL